MTALSLACEQQPMNLEDNNSDEFDSYQEDQSDEIEGKIFNELTNWFQSCRKPVQLVAMNLIDRRHETLATLIQIDSATSRNKNENLSPSNNNISNKSLNQGKNLFAIRANLIEYLDLIDRQMKFLMQDRICLFNDEYNPYGSFLFQKDEGTIMREIVKHFAAESLRRKLHQ